MNEYLSASESLQKLVEAYPERPGLKGGLGVGAGGLLVAGGGLAALYGVISDVLDGVHAHLATAPVAPDPASNNLGMILGGIAGFGAGCVIAYRSLPRLGKVLGFFEKEAGVVYRRDGEDSSPKFIDRPNARDLKHGAVVHPVDTIEDALHAHQDGRVSLYNGFSIQRIFTHELEPQYVGINTSDAISSGLAGAYATQVMKLRGVEVTIHPRMTPHLLDGKALRQKIHTIPVHQASLETYDPTTIGRLSKLSEGDAVFLLMQYTSEGFRILEFGMAFKREPLAFEHSSASQNPDIEYYDPEQPKAQF